MAESVVIMQGRTAHLAEGMMAIRYKGTTTPFEPPFLISCIPQAKKRLNIQVAEDRPNLFLTGHRKPPQHPRLPKEAHLSNFTRYVLHPTEHSW